MPMYSPMVKKTSAVPTVVRIVTSERLPAVWTSLTVSGCSQAPKNKPLKKPIVEKAWRTKPISRPRNKALMANKMIIPSISIVKNLLLVYYVVG